MAGVEQAATASETCGTEDHWDEFWSGLQCAAGAMAHTDGTSWLCEIENPYGWDTWRTPSEEAFRLWRLGWLWECYEDHRPGMRRDGQFKWHRYERQALAHDVLCVASLNLPLGRWRCYVASVSGGDHSIEWLAVAKHGTKLLPKCIAASVFPELAKRFMWEA